jgi:hypothetical protein
MDPSHVPGAAVAPALAPAIAGATVANYYQTLDGDVSGQQYTHWYAAALHFGTNEDGSPYIHWNDWDPDDARFQSAWTDLAHLKESGATVTFMLGGAGGAFQVLFGDFATYYALLRDFVKAHPVIAGLDLDIEEAVALDDVRALIRHLNTDFGPDFILTMAPLASSLAADVPGLGGFVYKDLWRTSEGARINWFNGQFYGGTWSLDTVRAIVDNGYPAAKVVMGMLYTDFPDPTQAFAELAECRRAFPDLRGAFVWEHALAPLGPRTWAMQAAAALSVEATGARGTCAIL